jgi:hypothetical protein
MAVISPLHQARALTATARLRQARLVEDHIVYEDMVRPWLR